LLRQADDVDQLRRFFRAYQIVQQALAPLRYRDYPVLDLDLDSALPHLETPAFSPDVQSEFDKWQKVD
jgi:hypothetical protein